MSADAGLILRIEGFKDFNAALAALDQVAAKLDRRFTSIAQSINQIGEASLRANVNIRGFTETLNRMDQALADTALKASTGARVFQSLNRQIINMNASSRANDLFVNQTERIYQSLSDVVRAVQSLRLADLPSLILKFAALGVTLKAVGGTMASFVKSISQVTSGEGGRAINGISSLIRALVGLSRVDSANIFKIGVSLATLGLILRGTSSHFQHFARMLSGGGSNNPMRLAFANLATFLNALSEFARINIASTVFKLGVLSVTLKALTPAFHKFAIEIKGIPSSIRALDQSLASISTSFTILTSSRRGMEFLRTFALLISTATGETKEFNKALATIGTLTPATKENLLDLGRDIVDGIKKGVESGDGLHKVSEQSAKRLINVFKKIFQIRSPSRTMLGIGRFIAQGLLLGLRVGFKATETVASDAARRIRTIFTDVQQTIQKGFRDQKSLRNIALDSADTFIFSFARQVRDLYRAVLDPTRGPFSSSIKNFGARFGLGLVSAIVIGPILINRLGQIFNQGLTRAVQLALPGFRTALNGAVAIARTTADHVVNTFVNTFRRLGPELYQASQQAINQGFQNVLQGGIAGLLQSRFFTSPAQAAIEFESAFAGVVKTVNLEGLGKEAAERFLGGLNEEIRDLATGSSPVAGLANAQVELANIAATAGQLGIHRDDIAKFSETIGMLNLSTNILGEEGAQSLAQFANIMESTDYDRIGAAIVDLGNNFPTTEATILEFAQRLAGVGQLAKLTEANVLALGTAMGSLGLNPEAGGTAFSKVVSTMIRAVSTGSDPTVVTGAQQIAALNDRITEAQEKRRIATLNLEAAQDRLNRARNVSSHNLALLDVEKWQAELQKTDEEIQRLQLGVEGIDEDAEFMTRQVGEHLGTFAVIAKMSVDEFITAFEERPAEAIRAFMQGLSELDAGTRLRTLEDLGFNDARVRDTLLRMTGNINLVTDALDRADVAWDENTALVNEATRRFETAEAQLARLKNIFRDVGISIGNLFLPDITAAAKGFGNFMLVVNDFIKNNPGLIKGVASFVALLGTLGASFITLTGVVQIVGGVFGMVLGVQVSAITGIFQALSYALMNPGGVVIGFGALTASIAGVLVPLGAVAAAFIGFRTVVSDIRNNIGGAGDEFNTFSTRIQVMFGNLRDVIDEIANIFRTLFGIVAPAEREFSPVATALSKVNELLYQMNFGLQRVRRSLRNLNSLFSRFAAFTDNSALAALLPNTSRKSQLLEQENKLLQEQLRLEKRIEDLKKGTVEHAEAFKEYTVEAGDTLSKIAADAGVSVEELAKVNNIENPNFIIAGQTLKIPMEGVIVDPEKEISRVEKLKQNIEQQLQTTRFLLGREDDSIVGSLSTYERIRTIVGELSGTIIFQNLFGGVSPERLDSLASKLEDLRIDFRQLRGVLSIVRDSFFQLFDGSVENRFATFKSNVSSMVKELKDVFSGLWDLIKDPFNDDEKRANLTDEDSLNPYIRVVARERTPAEKLRDAIMRPFEELDFSPLLPTFNSHFDVILGFALTAASMFIPGAGLFVGAVKALELAIRNDFLGIRTYLDKQGITAEAQNLFDTISTIFNNVFAVFKTEEGEKSMIQQVVDFFTVEAAQVVNGIKLFLNELGVLNIENPAETGGNIGSVIKMIIDAVAPIIGFGIDVFTDVFETVLPKVGTGIRQFLDGLEALSRGDSLGAVQSFVSSIVTLFTQLKGIGFTTGLAVISNIGERINPPDLTQAAAEGIVNVQPVQPAENPLVKTVKEMLATAGNWLLNEGLLEVGKFVGTLVGTIGHEVVNFVTSPQFSETCRQMADGFIQGFSNSLSGEGGEGGEGAQTQDKFGVGRRVADFIAGLIISGITLYLGGLLVTKGIGGAISGAIGLALKGAGFLGSLGIKGGGMALSFGADMFGGLVSKLASGIAKKIGEQAAFQSVTTALKTALSGAVNSAITAVSTAASGAVGAVASGLSAFASGIATAIPQALAAIPGIVSIAAPFVAVGLAAAAAVLAIKQFQDTYNTVQSAAEAAGQQLKPYIESGAINQQDAREAFWQDASTNHGDFLARVMLGYADLTGAFDTMFAAGQTEEIQTQAFETGQELAENVVTGFETGVAPEEGPTIPQGLQTMINNVKTETESQWGINSPSTVFAGYGRDLIAGLTQGLNEASPSLLETINTIFTNNVVTPVETVLGIAGGEDAAGGASWAYRTGLSIPSQAALGITTGLPALFIATTAATVPFTLMKSSITRAIDDVLSKLKEFEKEARKMLAIINAGIEASNNMTGGNIPTVGIGPGRARGGPIFPGVLHPIIEEGEPEVFHNTRGQTFLISPDGGFVTPMRGSRGGGFGSIDNRSFDQSVNVQVYVENGNISATDLENIRRASAAGVLEAQQQQPLVLRANRAGTF